MGNETMKERQRQEAEARLRILEGKGLMPEVRRDFEQGTLNYSERLGLPGFGTCGILYWLDGNPEFEKAIREVEERYGVVAYHATHEVCEFGELLDVFCVTEDEEEWAQDRADLEDGYSLVYSANLDCGWCSEFGTIAFECRGGGLVRAS